MFPFGVSANRDETLDRANGDETLDPEERGPDTVNRLLLHGARYHEREAVFLTWGQGRRGWGWQPTPDWRADRHAIRVALVLRQRLQIEEGERVAVWLPLGPEWAVIERGVWSIGAISVPLWPEWTHERVAEVLSDARPSVLFVPGLEDAISLRAIDGVPESVQAVVPFRAPEPSGEDWISFEKFMDYGGVLDTPERASMWRTYVRSLSPEVPASWEYAPAAEVGPEAAAERRELVQADFAAAAGEIARRFPPRVGGARVIAETRPTLLARALVYSGWADGVTRTVFVHGEAALARVAEWTPDIVLAPGESVEPVLAGVEPEKAEGPASGKGLVGRWKALLRSRSARANGGGAADPAAGPCFVLTDGERAPGAGVRVTSGVRFLTAAELEGALIGS